MTNKGTNTLRWPRFDGWDEMATAVETLAATSGAKVYCSQKYDYLRVEILQLASTPAQTRALHLVAELVEQASNREGSDHSDKEKKEAKTASERQLADNPVLQEVLLAEAYEANDPHEVDMALAKVTDVRRMQKSGILEWFDD